MPLVTEQTNRMFGYSFDYPAVEVNPDTGEYCIAMGAGIEVTIDEYGDEDSVGLEIPINFCPMCGKELKPVIDKRFKHSKDKVTEDNARRYTEKSCLELCNSGNLNSGTLNYVD